MSTRHDPRLLYSVGNINAYHIQNGSESSLTPSGPQTLTLLLVPTAAEDAHHQNLLDDEPGARPLTPEEDFYLHLHLPPELDIPMPATTQVFHQPPRSYLIPRWDLGPEAGAFTRIEFPKIGSGTDRVSQEEIDTFETILAQCTAFLEKKPLPEGKGVVPTYDPSKYQPGEGYVGGSGGLVKGDHHGHIVLIDEEDGSVVGELGEGYEIDEKTGVKPGDKNPVEIEMPSEGHPNRITVTPISDDYLQMSRHPAYKNSRIVQNAAMASRLIVTGSSGLASAITSGANAFTTKTKPAAKPMTFSPATQERVRKLNNLTHGAVGLSAQTVGQLGKYAQNFGAKLSRRDQEKHSKSATSTGGVDKHGRPLPAAEYKPSVLNKSMIAFSTIMDGVEQSAKHLLNTGASASSTMVSHRWGPDAGNVAGSIAGGVRNVGLVYVDATGVSRKAVLKSVAKGMVVGKMPNGQQLLVGEGDGGTVPEDAKQKYEGGSGTSASGVGAGGAGAPTSALEAARLQANAQANAASGTAPPPYSDPKGAGRGVGDSKYR